MIQKPNAWKLAMILSLLVHALLFGGLGGFGSSDGKEGKGKHESEGPEQGEHPNKSVDVPVMIFPKDPIGPGENDKPCPNSYSGIGVTVSFDGQVESVAEGHSAAVAGIKPGDFLITPIENIKNGKIGSPVQVVLRRGTKRVELTLVREKICTSPTSVDKSKGN